MLRIHFTADDVRHVRVARGPDPLWELSLSLHLLQNREAAVVFDPWRREVRAAIARAGLTRAVRMLAVLNPCGGYYPDFLTPGQGQEDLASGVDAVLSTPRADLRTQLERFARKRPLPPWTRDLAAGDPRTLEHLGSAMLRYYEIAVAPYLGRIRGHVAADRAARGAAVLDSGFEGMLAGYSPWMDWGDRRLTAPYPVRADLHLAGRGLVLVPSFFCVRKPITLADRNLPPVVVHPVDLPPGWLPRRDPAETAEQALAELLGATRAAILDSLDSGRTTTELADLMRLSLSTVSRHTAVLREAGVVDSRRRAQSVVHTRTALGDALLEGRVPRTADWERPA